MKASQCFFVAVLACFSPFLLAGCDATLNREPEDEISSDAVWNDQALIESYLTGVYAGVGYGYGNPTIAGGVDEAKNTHGHDDQPVRMSNMTPDDLGFWERGGATFEKFRWSDIYSQVRDINVFLKNIEGSEAVEGSLKERLKGEAYFLRAYYYHNLVRLWGGVPLIDRVFELTGDLSAYQVPRNSFAESIDFIVEDLNKAAERLPLQAPQQGRATRGAALALKSRILLFAASDLYADNPSGMPETGYTSGDQQGRWEAARDAAQAVMDLDQYRLYEGEYEDIWLQGEHDEIIWARYFTPSADEVHNTSLWFSPNGYGSWTGDAPLQQYVDAHEMTDGSEFSWDNPEHAENPYKNRDPRLHANVLYNGRDWRERPSGLREIDPKGVYQSGWYEMPGQEKLRPGLDTREGPVQTWNATKTGYNTKKFVDRSIDPVNEQAYNPWIFLRYAEVLLNYAEASAELGETQDAITALNQVRSRVDMPNVPADGGPNRSLMERVRNERRVELAFEEHRYFDVRRWMIASQAYQNGKGIRITGRLDENGELLVNHRYHYDYEVIEVDQRQWKDNAYFLPIPRDEMQRNPELVQNPGY